MKKLLKLYDESPTVDVWTESNTPDKDLLYRGGVATQEQKFSAISCLLGVDLPRVVSHHTSKSVKLPVVAYKFECKNYDGFELLAFVRDNFYGLNCTVVSTHEMDLNIADVYSKVSRELLEEQRVRALKYIGKLPFEILGTGEQDKKMRESTIKDYRTIAEDRGYDWYSTNWSGKRVIEHNGEFFISATAFWEGNPGVTIRDYEGVPTKNFTFTGGYTKVADIIQKAARLGKNEAYKAQYPERTISP